MTVPVTADPTGPEWLVLASGRSAQPRAPLSLRRLVILFTGSVALVIALVLTIGLVASRQVAKREAVHSVAQITDILAESVVQPVLTDEMATDPQAASAALDSPVGRGVLNTDVVRVKLWTPTGLVLYSDDARLIGQKFALDDEARDALITPRTEAGITDLQRPENAQDAQVGPLLEVYRPVWTPNGTPLLFEAYFRYDVVTSRSADLWRGFSGIMISCLLGALLLITPLLWIFYRRARAAHQYQEALTQRALDASTDERRRIATSLHDGVVQQLAGTSFLLAGEAQRLRRADDAAAVRMEEASATVRDSVAGMRSLLVDIYPPSLTEHGLAAALNDIANSQRGSGARITITVSESASSALTPDEQRAVFRVAQECLRNAVQHAEASEVSLTLGRPSGSVVLEVSDNGRGISAESALSVKENDHFGLRLITDAADEIGARLSVRSQPGVGSTFRLELPR